MSRLIINDYLTDEANNFERGQLVTISYGGRTWIAVFIKNNPKGASYLYVIGGGGKSYWKTYPVSKRNRFFPLDYKLLKPEFQELYFSIREKMNLLPIQ